MTNSDSLGGRFAFPGTALTVNRLGYGAMQLAGKDGAKLVWGPPKDENAAIAVLREAVAAGVDHIDTSDFYGPHVVNGIIKKALSPFPKNLVLVTKLGAKRPADGSWQAALSADDLKAGLHDNLRNLGREAMDVVNLRLFGNGHGPAEGSIEAPLAALIELERQGLIRHIGLSNVTPTQLAQGRAMTDIVCVQNAYNVALRGDDAMIDDLAKAGIAYVPFFPLGGFSPLQSSTIDDLAKSLEATPMQVALAWLLHRSPNILLIPGTSSVAHLRENLKAAELRLPAEAMATLDGIGAKR